MASEKLPITICERAANDRVIVYLDKTETKTASGLILQSDMLSRKGTVLSKGSKVTGDFSVGDTVYVGKMNGVEYQVRDIKTKEIETVLVVYASEIPIYEAKQSIDGNDNDLQH